MRILVLSLFVTLIIPCHAQKQANVWYFGRKIGIDFNVDPPVLLLDGQIDFDGTPDNLESASSIADENGNLLFYTNGVNVWNRLHALMPNGGGLYGRNTTTQTIIVPKPGSSTIFYIFTASPEGDDDYFPSAERGFHYSVVDLSQDSGLGDVVEKNIKLVTSTSEKISATKHVNGKDVWVVMHEWNNNSFRSYLVTEDGVLSDAIISRTGSIHSGGLSGQDNWNAIGQMKISPDGEKLALVTYISKQLEIFRFDPSSGKINFVSNISLLNGGGRLIGAEFSPSGRYLYVTEDFCNILQFDLTAPLIQSNILNVNNTPTCYNFAQLQLAPNGKIYIAQNGYLKIGVINKPDELGLFCEYQNDAIEIPPDGIHSCNLGLPNFISSYFYNDELYPQRPYFEMPNVFTPNHDGYNDRFIPRTMYNVESVNLALYNRWGKKIYETNDLESGWDGGEFSKGVYYWQATYTGENRKHYSQKGTVELIR